MGEGYANLISSIHGSVTVLVTLAVPKRPPPSHGLWEDK